MHWAIAFVEIVFSMGMVINALLFIPQIIRLYKTKNSQELSLLTFAGFNLIQLFTLLHGVIHNDKLLVFGMLFSLVMCGAVTFLIMYYRMVGPEPRTAVQSP